MRKAQCPLTYSGHLSGLHICKGTKLLTRKQELYIDILELLLPHARNVQTWGMLRRTFYSDLYPELELVHNIPPLLAKGEFCKEDVFWLNTQACNYLEQLRKGDHPHCSAIKYDIQQLENLVPSELNESLSKRLIELVQT